MDVQAPFKPVEQEDIFDLLGAGAIPEEEKGALLGQMLLLIQQQVFVQVMESLPQEAIAQLEDESDVEEENTARLEIVIDKYIPNYANLYDEEARKVRRALIAKIASDE